MALIGYARVSTADQKLALQHDALIRAGCERTFDDHASGARADRPGLAEALAYLRAGDTLVVWKLDRLGRSMRHLIAQVGDLAARGIGFRSLTESIDTTTPGGMLVFNIFGSLAQFERDLIRERTQAGLRAARERGAQGGRRPVVTPDKLRKARAHIAAGLTVREAAARLKIGKTALYKALGCGTIPSPPTMPHGPPSAAPSRKRVCAPFSTRPSSSRFGAECVSRPRAGDQRCRQAPGRCGS